MAKNNKKVKQETKNVPVEAIAKRPLSDLLSSDEVYEAVFTLKGEEYQVKIRRHIPALQRTVLLDRVESLYFVNGDYDPAYGDLSVRYIIARMYTDESFDDDIDVYERFANETDFEQHLPEEASELVGSVTDKVAYLVGKHGVPDEQKKMYEAIGSMCATATEALNSVMAYLDGAEKALSQETGVSLGEVIKTLQNLSKQDEKKITAAILDYQAEKAKKRVVAKRMETQ